MRRLVWRFGRLVVRCSGHFRILLVRVRRRQFRRFVGVMVRSADGRIGVAGLRYTVLGTLCEESKVLFGRVIR